MKRKSKYKGIDERVIKCCNPFNNENSIEAGISIGDIDGAPILNFHFLEIVNTVHSTIFFNQTTKGMFLSRESRDQLVKELKSIKFKK